MAPKRIPPKNVIVSTRLPYKLHTYMEAVRIARGESRTEIIIAAVEDLVAKYQKTGAAK